MTASFVSSSLKTGRFIFIWPPDFLWHCWPWCGCLKPLDLSDLDDTDEEVDAELQSLSNPQSGNGKGGRGGLTHSPHCPWPWSFCNVQPHSWYDGPRSHLGTSHHSTGVEGLATCRDKSCLWKLNGADAGGMEQGHPGPLGLMHHLVIAWAINH